MVCGNEPVQAIWRRGLVAEEGSAGHIEPLHNAAGISGTALKISRADE